MWQAKELLRKTENISVLPHLCHDYSSGDSDDAPKIPSGNVGMRKEVEIAGGSQASFSNDGNMLILSFICI